MSKVQRYILVYTQATTDPSGAWCESSDVAQLEAENVALEKRLEELEKERDAARASNFVLYRENAAISERVKELDWPEHPTMLEIDALRKDCSKMAIDCQQFMEDRDALKAKLEAVVGWWEDCKECPPRPKGTGCPHADDDILCRACRDKWKEE